MGGFANLFTGAAGGAATGAAAGPYAAIAGAIVGFANEAMKNSDQVAALFVNSKNVQAKALGADITNKIEGGMDFNRLAFISGSIPVKEFEANYFFLWQTLEEGAIRVASAGTAGARAYAARMTSDRDYGGQFAFEWRGIMHDDIITKWFPVEKLDGYGFVLPEYQEAWPLKSRYMETGLPDMPGTLPQIKLPPGETAATRPPPLTKAPSGNLLKYAAIGAAAIGGFFFFKGK